MSTMMHMIPVSYAVISICCCGLVIMDEFCAVFREPLLNQDVLVGLVE
jgi:hypothetical protein